MRVAIIILSWNSKHIIDSCLQGLLKYESCKIYIVDNGSVDGSVDYIFSKYPNVKLICLPTNVGFGSGNNVGIKQAIQDGYDAFFLLNNDTIIDEKFIGQCVKVIKENPKVGIVGPVLVYADNQQLIQGAGGKITLWNLDFSYLKVKKRFIRSDRIDKVGYVIGAAMLITKEVIQKTNGFDPDYYPAYVEEADLCYRARAHGYESAVCFSTRVRHIGEMSAGSDQKSFRCFTANRFLFGLKHLKPFQFFLASQLIIFRVFLKKIFGR